MTKTNDNIIIYGVGDIAPDRDNPESMFQHVTDVVKSGDISFCHLECVLSNRGVGPHAKDVAKDPKMASVLKKTGFDIVGMASNHNMGAGMDAFLDSIDHLKEQDLKVIGVGRNIEEARTPGIFDCRGTKIAFLDYNAVLEPNAWAEANRPGAAPLRVKSFFEPLEPFQPGTPARVFTYPDRGDMSAMIEDVKKAKKQADVVIVSIHSGVHLMPAIIADYQKDCARAAIDNGADLVLQHHAHILKGIEVYKGKVIFYGLGNFAIELWFMTKEWANIPQIRDERRLLNPDWNPPYDDYPSFPFPPDSRKTIIAKCEVSNKAVSKVSFLPVYINKASEPEILTPQDKRFGEVVSYVEEISRDQGLKTNFIVEGSEVIINK
jgi:poly-gamma-glutamate capsule biosynthesis protein CapA/YwtB (metallophosphatase superfamily)